LFNFYYMPALKKEAEEHLKGFDVIHLNCYRSYQNLVLRRHAMKYGIPYIVDSHGSLPRTVGGRKNVTWLLKYLFDTMTGTGILKDAARVISQTTGAMAEYREFGITDERIVRIPQPFDTEEFRDLPPPGSFRQAYGIPDKKIILSLGRIHRIKGLRFLVESFQHMAAARDDVVLVIAGNDDGYLPELKRIVRNLDLADSVIFTGFVRGEAKLSALVDADVLVQTSLYEYGTGVPFEAILCGTPIIVSRETMASENVKDIDAGYLTEYGNHDDLTAMMNHVLENPAEAQAKTEKAREYIRANLSLEKVVGQYEQLYREVMTSP
ncbi:MAG: glycosyltransferase, partial [Dehalococcoidales bacterium]|nr:glycosyltransferase [Dehalococcoidales bacterium]